MDEDGEEIPVDPPDSDTTCNICYAEFLEPEDLKVHINQMHLPEKYKCYCQFCDSTFSNMEAYAIHLRDIHLGSLKCCKHCTKAFTDFDLQRRHENKHFSSTIKTSYSCSQCEDKFINVTDLEQHEMNIHDNNNDGIVLKDCYSVLSSVLNIKARDFLRSIGTNTIYICVKCELTTPDANAYLKHLQELECRSYACDRCSNIYKERYGLTKHLSQHKECCHFTKKKDMKKRCKECYKYIDTLSYQSHLKHCKPIKCTVCNIIFESVSNLSAHQTKKHPLAIMLQKCQFCRKEFVGSVALEKHIDRTHKGQLHLYKYACVYCEMTYFKHPQALFAHFFSKHQSIQPFCCKICDKTFRVRKRFTIHIKLDHKSVGYVEFDENYHVYFTDKKSDNPFQPTSLFPKMVASTADVQDDTHDEESVQPTELETDAERDIAKEKKSAAGRKPPKIRYKEQEKAGKSIKPQNVNSDCMSITETEGNKTETEIKPKKLAKKRKLKRNLKSKKVAKMEKSEIDNLLDSEEISDDEPLLKVKKREKLKRMTKLQFASWNKKKMRNRKDTKKRFTCNICKKYCYTFQNYNHHISLHFRDEVKKCIKCEQEFRSKTELKKHVDTAHASSRLTETLKSLLERRKSGGVYTAPQLTMAEKFQRTMKRVRATPSSTTATVSELQDKLSVQKFIESFTPDETAKKNVNINSVVTVKTVKNAIMKPPVIKMKKFIPKPVSSNLKLSMPIKYKQSSAEKTKVSIKLIQKMTTNNTMDCNNETDFDNYQEESFVEYEEEVEDSKNDTVPEVDQEVELGSTEEPKPVEIPHKILLPNLQLPKGYKEVRIAHLLPQAPFFKIVKMKDLVKQQEQKETSDKQEDAGLKLPDGTKLVNVNPLAHLLGNASVETIVGASYNSKYYKPKKSANQYEEAIARALCKLEKPEVPKRRASKKKASEVPETVQVEQ